MAISNLLPAQGANDNRPNLKQFFGKNPATANDNVQRVSSGMFSNAFIDSVVGALQGLAQEIAKITEIAQKVIASFGNIVESIKALNKDVTNRFRVLNNELNASKIDFIRTVLAIPKTDTPVKIDGVPVNVKQEEQKKEGDADGFFEKLIQMWLVKNLGEGAIALLKSLLDFAKGTMVTLIKFVAETLPRLLALLEGALTGPAATALANGLRAAIFNPVTLAGAGFIALAYWAGEQRKQNPEAWVDFQLKMRGAGERSKVITGPQAETDKFGPLEESGVIRPFDVLKANGLVKDQRDIRNVVDFADGDIITLKDGRWFDTKSKSTELQPAETNPSAKAKAKKGRPTTGVSPSGLSTTGMSGDTQAGGSSVAPSTSTMPLGTPTNSTVPALGTTGAGSFSPGGVTGSPPPTNQMGTPAGEIKTESNVPAPPPSGAPSGTPAATSMAPPPAGPSGGEGAGSGGGVAVVQNSSVQNVGTTAGAENGGMTGQNLPMFARNPKLQSTFGMQNVRYQ